MRSKLLANREMSYKYARRKARMNPIALNLS